MNEEVNAVITCVGGYVPDYVLTNGELSEIVDTTDEWIMTRIGIKERRILKEKNSGTSVMGTKAVEDLFKKTDTKPEDIELVICTTTTPDYFFPSTAALIATNTGMKNAFAFDMEAACSGFLFGLETASSYIKSGRYKKIILVSGDKLSSVTNYSDRATCPIFGDGAGAVLVEPTSEKLGVLDSRLYTDAGGFPYLHIKYGGSAYPATEESIKSNGTTIYQEGKAVFKFAVTNMSDASELVMKRNGLTKDDIDWMVPHQANIRIIDAVANRMDFDRNKVMVNIQKFGNTSAGTIPLCLWEWEDKLKKGDNLILTAFGGGFTWGALYLKWAYNGKSK
ncbi:MAG: ketoacyl-ACP synthase III [Candidatus Azobacteroides sp.]|nr:ketoacyl-ACP synthase III [Candidatus Azobacteroides sp.]